MEEIEDVLIKVACVYVCVCVGVALSLCPEFFGVCVNIFSCVVPRV